MKVDDPSHFFLAVPGFLIWTCRFSVRRGIPAQNIDRDFVLGSDSEQPLQEVPRPEETDCEIKTQHDPTYIEMVLKIVEIQLKLLNVNYWTMWQ